MADAVPPTDGYTVKEIVSAIQTDVRALSGKLDGYISSHQGQHSADSAVLAGQHGDPASTPAGRQLHDDIDALGKSLREEVTNRREAMVLVTDAHDVLAKDVARHDVLIQRMIGAGSLLTILLGVYEALRVSRIVP